MDAGFTSPKSLRKPTTMRMQLSANYRMAPSAPCFSAKWRSVSHTYSCMYRLYIGHTYRSTKSRHIQPCADTYSHVIHIAVCVGSIFSYMCAFVGRRSLLVTEAEVEEPPFFLRRVFFSPLIFPPCIYLYIYHVSL